jgi:predicted nuclease with RNAse H fold
VGRPKSPPQELWLGVDVGAERKGFDVALVDRRSLRLLVGGLTVEGVVTLAAERSPVLVAIDSPRSCAPAGHASRACERALNHAVCGIRWTPDHAHVQGSDYYAWVRHGLELFAALGRQKHRTIEVFPTASWTRWCGRGAPPAVRCGANGASRSLACTAFRRAPTRTSATPSPPR